jgi:hypothetical protein
VLFEIWDENNQYSALISEKQRLQNREIEIIADLQKVETTEEEKIVLRDELSEIGFQLRAIREEMDTIDKRRGVF